MGRPRKYPLPVAPVGAAEPEVDEEPEEELDLESLPPEQLVEEVLARPLMKLTPRMWQALNDTARDLALADDDQAKTQLRRIAGRLRRTTHGEQHPGCQLLKINVPALRRHDGNGVWYVTINERKYFGEVEVWECTARQIFELVARYNEVEANRKSETQHALDLDTGAMLADRIQAIKQA